jgi:hypothetical protein
VEELNFIMTEYDFIGVTERLDETLIVFMLLLHLPMSDILNYSSKIQGDLFSRQVGQPCVRLQRSRLTSNMTAFLESPECKAKVESYGRLYRVANASLDRTIDSLGRAMVAAELGRFKKAQAVVNERCRGRVVMPCDEKGQLYRPVHETGCFIEDIACGMDCLDEVATELQLWEPTNVLNSPTPERFSSISYE